MLHAAMSELKPEPSIVMPAALQQEQLAEITTIEQMVSEGHEVEAEPLFVTFLNKYSSYGPQNFPPQTFAIAYRLGVFHYQQARDDAALKRFELAAWSSDPYILFYTGQYFERFIGYGNEAFACYRRAADMGHAEAQYSAALCCIDGIGTPVDKESAFTLLKLADAQGHKEAAYHLGLLYFERGDTPNAIKAIERAAGRGMKYRPQCILSLHYKNARVRHKAEFWQKRALKNNANSRYDMDMGFCHEYGFGTPIDYSQARACYIAADRKTAGTRQDIKQAIIAIDMKIAAQAKEKKDHSQPPPRSADEATRLPAPKKGPNVTPSIAATPTAAAPTAAAAPAAPPLVARPKRAAAPPAPVAEGATVVHPPTSSDPKSSYGKVLRGKLGTGDATTVATHASRPEDGGAELKARVPVFTLDLAAPKLANADIAERCQGHIRSINSLVHSLADDHHKERELFLRWCFVTGALQLLQVGGNCIAKEQQTRWLELYITCLPFYYVYDIDEHMSALECQDKQYQWQNRHKFVQEINRFTSDAPVALLTACPDYTVTKLAAWQQEYNVASFALLEEWKDDPHLADLQDAHHIRVNNWFRTAMQHFATTASAAALTSKGSGTMAANGAAPKRPAAPTAAAAHPSFSGASVHNAR